MKLPVVKMKFPFELGNCSGKNAPFFLLLIAVENVNSVLAQSE